MGNAWSAHADGLARWALARQFNRMGQYGGCYVDKNDGQVKPTIRHSKGPQDGCVSGDLLVRHFRAARAHGVVGAQALRPDIPHARAMFDLIGANETVARSRAVWRWVAEWWRVAFTKRECFGSLRKRAGGVKTVDAL